MLVSEDVLDKFSPTTYMGPYKIMKVNDHSTIKFQMGSELDLVNIPCSHPYDEWQLSEGFGITEQHIRSLYPNLK